MGGSPTLFQACSPPPGLWGRPLEQEPTGNPISQILKQEESPFFPVPPCPDVDPIGVAETQCSLLITKGMSRSVLGVLPIDLGLCNVTGSFLLSPYLRFTSPSAKASHCILGASHVAEPRDRLC